MLISECYVKYCKRSLFADLQVTTLDLVTQSIATIIEIRRQRSHWIFRCCVNRLTSYRQISSCHFLYIDRDTVSYAPIAKLPKFTIQISRENPNFYVIKSPPRAVIMWGWGCKQMNNFLLIILLLINFDRFRTKIQKWSARLYFKLM